MDFVMMLHSRPEVTHGRRIDSHCSSRRADGGLKEKRRLPGYIIPQNNYFHVHPVHTLTGALYPPTHDHQSKLRSPRSGRRTFSPALARDLEHVELLKLVIAAHYAHAAGALSPGSFPKENRRRGDHSE